MSANVDKLKAIMTEMFQLDQAELDFGIYRIMNQKRDEIEKFLDKDLLPQVEAAFSDFGSTTKETLVDELDKMKVEIERLGYVAEDNPKYMEKKAALAKAVDVTALENEVFSHLASFFRRYYKDGDFLSLRRYKAGVYAIPYEGEEVKLHWANADQYYIKSSENFRDYTFKLQSGKKVHFKLIEASTEQNNKKEQTGKERRFILVDDTPLVVDNDELYIRFEYRIADEKGNQTALNETAVQTVLASTEGDWKRELSSFAPTEKNPRRTILGKHLNDYTAKYSFDYFIHKDLGGFMRRELDFFIKNEVLFIDDLDVEHVKSSIAKVKVVKGIGLKIISFLEQLENFQRKLWLKKKFVVETGYCVTLDKVPEELYPTIINNTAQVEEWKRLFNIQDIEGDLHTPKYTVPLSIEFLKANPFLLLDTVLFDGNFTEKLLAAFDNLEEATDGLLINGDNFHALSLITSRYNGQVKAVYIDPPYNATATEIIYKNDYKHSSWLAFIQGRLELSRRLMRMDGIICATIDDYEEHRLRMLMEEVFGSQNYLATVPIRNNPSGRSTVKGFAINHEYGLFFAKSVDDAQVGRLPHNEDQKNRYDNTSEDGKQFEWENFRKNSSASFRSDRPKQYYPLYYCKHSGALRIPTVEWNEKEKSWTVLDSTRADEQVLLPLDSNGLEKVWRFGIERASLEVNEMCVKELDGRTEVYKKKFLRDDGSLPRTWWDNPAYSARDNGTRALSMLFGSEKKFDFPKSVDAVKDSLKVSSLDTEGIALDYFGGSGTTGHAVINLNRQDDGNRKYILVEMGDHFDTALKPRIQKVIYSKDWNNGKPVSREGSSHLFKYIRLESYEDALNNLHLKSTDAQQSLLTLHDELREDYMLSYMLDVESHGSASLLNTDAFKDPFGYQMKIACGNETKNTTIDLMETFNYLLGIKVLRISAPERRTAEFALDGEGRLKITGKPRSCNAGEGWLFREVEGATLGGEKVLIIWRTLTGNAEEDNLMLENYFSKRNYSTLDFEFNRIYVNGDNNLENLKIGEEQWKVTLIEEEFKRLMFDAENL